MDDDLFPNLARRGNTRIIPDGLDADTGFYSQRSAGQPKELTVTDDAEVGKLYGPDGRRYRTVKEARPRVPFGFHPGKVT